MESVQIPQLVIRRRRENIFLLVSGLFLGSMVMLNILGISRFLDLSFSVAGLQIPLFVAVGVLPYPITFLATDILSELYGKRRANAVVWVGLLLNLFVVCFLWLGSVLPGAGDSGRAFMEIKALAFGAVTASMIAYLAAQFTDVYLFHFWKELTRGKHLWLRNNGSTLISQLVDSFAVVLITHFYAHALPVDTAKPLSDELGKFIFSNYTFKFAAALLDTIPFYVTVRFLRGYLSIPGHDSLEKESL